jgi:hypothetical protein
VAYLNGSKVLTTGSALTFDGTVLANYQASGSIRKGNAAATLYTSLENDGVYSTGTDLYLVAPASRFIAFYANNAEQMRLTSTGLGIGTSSPVLALSVNKTSDTTFTNLPANILSYDTTAMAAGVGGGLWFGGKFNSGNDSQTVFAAISGVKENGTSGNTAGTLVFGVRDSGGGVSIERMRLDASGNLGLGVTPSAWVPSGAGGPILQIQNAAFFGSASTTGVLNNAYYNSGFKYISSDYASWYEQIDSKHVWYNAPSGTAGDAISFSQVMTLDASGNLGVGATSISTVGSYRVAEINGTGGGYLRLSTAGSASGAVGAGAGGAFLETFGANPTIFYTNSAERARITSGGYFKASNVGTYNDATGNYYEFRGDTANSYVVITTCTNATPLSEYIQDFRFSAATPNDGNARFWSCTDATAERAYIRSNGGLSNYSANDTNLSDRREKTNFAPATAYLDKICAIPVQTFNYIDQNMEDDGGLTLGVVAQDVQAVAPELVTESNWGSKENPKMRLSIYQTDLQYALMKALQELKAEFDAYKASHP